MASAKAKTRRDPTPRFLGAMPFWDNLENADPTRRYVWANTKQAHLPGGPDWYGMLGYRVETMQDGGVRPLGVRSLKANDEIVVGEGVLMSIDLDEYDAQQAAAQAKADERERQIIKRKGIPDALRGIRSPYFKVSGEVSGLERDFGGAADG